MEKSAIIDRSEQYIYSVSRTWEPKKPKLMFILLHPSRLDPDVDTEEMGHLIDIATENGFGGLKVCYLYALRVDSPDDLENSPYDIVGSKNNEFIYNELLSCKKVVAGWGTTVIMPSRAQEVLDLLTPYYDVYCMAETSTGKPRDPKYLAYNNALDLYRERN